MDRITALEARVAALEQACAQAAASVASATQAMSVADVLMRSAGYLPPDEDAAPSMAVVAPKPSPAPAGATTLALLNKVRLALVSNNNCTATDRPDLPPAPDTAWVTDFSAEIAAVDRLIEMASGSLCIAPECAGESKRQPSEPSTNPPTPSVEPEGSRTQQGGRL